MFLQPTPPKKPPRRNLSVSPTHLQPMMSASVEGVSNNAYEYLFLARSGARSQSDLDDIDSKPTTGRQLRHGRSVDTYVEMNAVFSLAPEDIDEVPHRELHRGKSEDLDVQRPKQEPVALTKMYENMIVKTTNPRRKLRRNIDRDNIYEQYDFNNKDNSLLTSSSAPDTTYVTSAYLTIKDSQEDLENSPNETVENDKSKFLNIVNIPLSPTHYNQPPTPDHPPPSALQAEKSIHERIRPLSQVS